VTRTHTRMDRNAGRSGALGPGRSQCVNGQGPLPIAAIKIAQALAGKHHRRAFAHYAMGRALHLVTPKRRNETV